MLELLYFLVAVQGTRTPFTAIVPGMHALPDTAARSFVRTFAAARVDERTVLQQAHVFAQAYRRCAPIQLRMRRLQRFHIVQYLPNDTGIRLRRVGTSGVLLRDELDVGFTAALRVVHAFCLQGPFVNNAWLFTTAGYGLVHGTFPFLYGASVAWPDA